MQIPGERRQRHVHDRGVHHDEFATPLPLPEYTPEHFPGWMAFQQLISRVAACIGTDPEDPRAFFTGQLIWQQMHGIVSLRISRSKFPWPPLAETVVTAVDRLLG